ncbi:MAG: tetratricopeptide repeat protein [bacterium]
MRKYILNFTLFAAFSSIILVLYSGSIKSPFLFDDTSKILNNPDIKKLYEIGKKLIYPYSEAKTTFRNDPSRPVTYFSFALNYNFGKLDTFGYHLFNVILHILNTLFVFMLVKRLMLNMNKDFYFVPLFTALFFAVHPINTSAVSYIFSRSILLSMFFCLSSLLLFFSNNNRKRFIYVMSILCFVMALFSRQDAVFLPVIILLFDYLIVSDFSIKKVLSKKWLHAPFWILILIFFVFRYSFLGGMGDMETDILWPRFSYLIIQPYVVVKYIQMLLIPVGLCIDHVVGIPKTIFEPRIIFSALLICALLSAAVVVIVRAGFNARKLIIFSAAWFLITILPTSSFFPTTSALAENRMYISSMGFLLFLVLFYLSAGMFALNKASVKHPVVVICCLMSIHLILLSTITYKRNKMYQKPELLWYEAISFYPGHERAAKNASSEHNRHAIAYKEKEEYQNAIEEYKKIIELRPGYANGYNDIGVLYKEIGEYDKAISAYKSAIALNPNYTDAHNNLGNVYLELNDKSSALYEYTQAVNLNPDYAEAHNNMANLYYFSGDYEKAVEKYKDAIKIDPNLTAAHINLGVVYFKQGNYSEALNELEIAEKQEPENKSISQKITIIKKHLSK